MTMARSSRSPCAASSASPIAASTPWLIALRRSSRWIVSHSTPPRRSALSSPGVGSVTAVSSFRLLYPCAAGPPVARVCRGGVHFLQHAPRLCRYDGRLLAMDDLTPRFEQAPASGGAAVRLLGEW